MAENSKIEWCDHTFNPWIGCQRVSPGCDYCYAEMQNAHRKWTPGWGPGAPRTRTSTAYWRQPLKWNRDAETAQLIAMRTGVPHVRPRVFCASLADVFDKAVPDEWRADLWSLIAVTQCLDWLLLTKRPQNIAKMLPPEWGNGWPNVWLGTTVENQEEADRRIPHLLNVPAAKRFLSCEPLLGPVDLTNIRPPEVKSGEAHGWSCIWTENHVGRPVIDWVICGGESGPSARPMHPDWARALRDQCVDARVPFFFKQWGEWLPFDHDDDESWYAKHPRSLVLRFWDGAEWQPADLVAPEHPDDHQWVARIGKKAAGALLDGREWREFPV